MLPTQMFDLSFDDREAKWVDHFPARTMWKLVFLLCLKDRADEVWLFRRNGKFEMQYRVNGEFHELVPPPDHIVPAMVEDVRDLARPRGFRAWIIQRLRAIIRLLEGPLGGNHTSFALFAGDHWSHVEVSPEGEDGVILSLTPTSEMSREAHSILADYFQRRGESVSPEDEQPADPPDGQIDRPVHPS